MPVFPTGPQDAIKYTMTAPDGNVATFNDPTDPNYVGMAWFSGLESPEIREAIDPRTAADGMVQGLNFRGGRPVIGTVEIQAISTTDRNLKFQKLRRACNALRSDGTLDFTPSGGLASRVYFRLSQPIRRNDERGWKYTVQFPLMAANPYILSQSTHTTTNTTDGGASITVTNQGDGYAAPVFNVTMTSTSALSIANNTTGEAVSTAVMDPVNFITYVSKFGSAGTGNSQFSRPWGVTTDASGNIYVADYSNHRVKKFNSAGIWQQTIGTTGYAAGQLNFPIDVAVDASGNIYVSDLGKLGSSFGRVQKFNSSGTYLALYQPSGGPAAIGGVSGQVGGIALDSSGTYLHFCDTGLGVIRKLTASTMAINLTYGSLGSGTNQFSKPYGIALDASNQPHITDYAFQRVSKWSSAATPVWSTNYNTNGADGGSWGSSPFGIAFDGSGNFYVSDTASASVAKFNSSGVYQTKFGSSGSADGQFTTPGILDVRGTTAWVPDVDNNRIQQFNVTTSSGIVVVDNAVAAVTTTTGSNLFQYVDLANTSWWSLAPGDNTVQVSGGGIDAFTVTWRDSWL